MPLCNDCEQRPRHGEEDILKIKLEETAVKPFEPSIETTFEDLFDATFEATLPTPHLPNDTSDLRNQTVGSHEQLALHSIPAA